MIPRAELLRFLKGQTVHIPDIQSLFESWPQATNPRVDELRSSVDRKLEALFKPGKRLQQTKSADLALFSATWWPYAEYEALEAAAFLSVWLFTWDDETDSVEFAALADDFEHAELFRQETLRYVQHCMSRRGESISSNGVCAPKTPLISSFQAISDAILPHISDYERRSLLHELEVFVYATQLEQQYQVSNDLPSIEEYIERRMGSGGVAVNLAIHEHALGISLPDVVRLDPDMALIWRHTNLIICTVNDMLSFKKEIAQAQVDSLIPLMYSRSGSLQQSMDEAFEIVCASKAHFEAAADRLLLQCDQHGDDTLRSTVSTFVDSCKYACTGNLNWSVVSARYRLGVCDLKGGMTISI